MFFFKPFFFTKQRNAIVVLLLTTFLFRPWKVALFFVLWKRWLIYYQILARRLGWLPWLPWLPWTASRESQDSLSIKKIKNKKNMLYYLFLRSMNSFQAKIIKIDQIVSLCKKKQRTAKQRETISSPCWTIFCFFVMQRENEQNV